MPAAERSLPRETKRAEKTPRRLIGKRRQRVGHVVDGVGEGGQRCCAPISRPEPWKTGEREPGATDLEFAATIFRAAA